MRPSDPFLSYPTLTVQGQPLTSGQLRALAEAIHAGDPTESWPALIGADGFADRRMDRALQWLRSAGIIQWSNRKWCGVPDGVADTTAAPSPPSFKPKRRR